MKVKPEYCTQNDGDCENCSLANYGKDCQNNEVMDDPDLLAEWQRELLALKLKLLNLAEPEIRGLRERNKTLAQLKYDIRGMVYSFIANIIFGRQLNKEELLIFLKTYSYMARYQSSIEDACYEILERTSNKPEKLVNKNDLN